MHQLKLDEKQQAILAGHVAALCEIYNVDLKEAFHEITVEMTLKKNEKDGIDFVSPRLFVKKITFDH